MEYEYELDNRNFNRFGNRIADSFFFYFLYVFPYYVESVEGSSMRNHKLCYLSSYDRGLEHLLIMWPEIKKKYKDATLDICYGWDTFDAMLANNAERQQWKSMMVTYMTQPDITHHGRIGKAELTKLRQSCGILAYPSNFYEIFCITVIEAQLDGCVPVTTGIGALAETNETGIIVSGDINEEGTQQEYLKELLALMGDEDRRKKMSVKGMEWAKKFSWEKIAKLWSDEFQTKDESVKLSLYIPTIRKGWWNIMCDNMSKQTYKNFEVIVVDDYPEDRSAIAKEYADKYKLDIKYLRGKPRKVKRTYGLCNANNTALDACTGEVMVFLQDFILMPLDGLEQIATLYRREPNALQGLPDMYFYSKYEPDTTKEDWFDGKTDVMGQYIRQNVRIANLGLRPTSSPMDYEQNYGAIPVKIARELGGWWEFYDFGLGFDNTSIGYRALKAGYKIIIDETNVAVCIDHFSILNKTAQNGGMERARRLNDPIYYFETDMIDDGKLPIKRTQEIDDQIDLSYEVPKEVTDDKMNDWILENRERLCDEFKRKYYEGFM